MASGLGLQQPDTNANECWSYDIASRARNIDKLNPAGRIWSIQRCTGSKNLLEAIRDPFIGSNSTKTSNLSPRWIRGCSSKMLERLGRSIKKNIRPLCGRMFINNKPVLCILLFYSTYLYR